jgi:hypothetical protein
MVAFISTNAKVPIVSFTYHNRNMCSLPLFINGSDHSFNGWFKQFSNISPAVSRHGETRAEEECNAYPGSFSWPARMSKLVSLSRGEPNLMYDGSSSSLKVCFVVLSKASDIAAMTSSTPNFEFRSFSAEKEIYSKL